LQWQELAIFRFKPDDVHRVTVTTDREYALVRNDKKEWTWVKGTEPTNTTNVQSLLNTVTALRAMRWAGATSPAHGLDKLQATVTFTTSPDDKAVHKIVVGASAGEGTWFAKCDEREGTFVIGNPDLNALKLPLVAAAAPAPSQAPASSSSPAANPSGTALPVVTASPH
jgi:hypothetical protein